jgi:hypothetical protein
MIGKSTSTLTATPSTEHICFQIQLNEAAVGSHNRLLSTVIPPLANFSGLNTLKPEGVMQHFNVWLNSS